MTHREAEVARDVGPVDILLGGPPCQGHSNLNNHTRRDDPKNRLYLRMARAAEVLRPRVLLVENVPAVVHDVQQVVDRAKRQLERAGYVVATERLELTKLGVPQARRRHILLAVRADEIPRGVEVAQVLSLPEAPERDLRWAIGDLEHVASDQWIDLPSKATSTNQGRIKWLFDNDAYDLPNEHRPECHQGNHSYVSMYGRLRWDVPAQTLTSGFGSMGQGRFVHPSKQRTLTPHEAARIQGFPDYFGFETAATRTQLSVIIGNAVPPAVTRSIAARLISLGILSKESPVEESAVAAVATEAIVAA